MFKLDHSEKFDVTLTERRESDGITILTVNANAKRKPSRLRIKINWEFPIIGCHLMWGPFNYEYKRIMPNWGGSLHSCISASAPIMTTMSYDDTNRLTISCSDAKNSVRIAEGVNERTANLDCEVTIRVECAVSEYTSEIKIDTRAVPFYEAIKDTVKWWETFDGYKPAVVPTEAKLPLYSTWYSFHQNVDVERITEECRKFYDLGCRAVIVDDGWQTTAETGYTYCGDWMPIESKVPDMKAFVDAVHDVGMKFILWYSVPFAGCHSEAAKLFEGKFLKDRSDDEKFVLDPRYPEVREYLINKYKNAVLDWGLDGFKLDFVDSFSQSPDTADGMDYVSVYDAVDRLFKDALSTLRELNPNILIEFRQQYIGPLMRTFGNMFRAGDCPNDSNTNRLSTLSLRLTSGNTAVHSDMTMWNYSEPVELAAFQLTGVLFSVPQISVLYERLTDEHRAMVKNYLGMWQKYQDVLMDGEMSYKGFAEGFSYVSSLKDNRQVGAVYSGRFAYPKKATDEIVLVNATMDDKIFIDAAFGGCYVYTVCDCMGNTISNGTAELSEISPISVPANGYIILVKK